MGLCSREGNLLALRDIALMLHYLIGSSSMCVILALVKYSQRNLFNISFLLYVLIIVIFSGDIQVFVTFTAANEQYG